MKVEDKQIILLLFNLHYSYCCSLGLKGQLIVGQGNALGRIKLGFRPDATLAVNNVG